MKKFFKLIMVLLLSMVFALSGCDLLDNKQNGPQGEETPTEETIDFDNVGYTMTDAIDLMNKWFTLDKQEFENELRCFSCDNVYVNKLNVLKIVSCGRVYPIIDAREDFEIDSATSTLLKEILKFSILENGSLALSYYDGSYMIFDNLWGLSNNDKKAIKSIVINKENCVVLIYEDNTFTAIGKLKCEQVDKDDSRLVYKKYGATYKIVDVFSTKIEKVEIPETFMDDPVTVINGEAFKDTKNLEEITISKNVKFIHLFAFSNCTNLKKVYYRGSEEDWANIDIELGNSPLLNATIIYNYS